VKIALASTMMIAAAALMLPCGAYSGDRVYRWVDKSGQENFTDNIDNIPEQYRSKFVRDDDESQAKKTGDKKKKKGASQASDADAYKRSYQASPQPAYRRPGTPFSDQYDQELAKKRQKQTDLKKQMDELNSQLAQKTDELNNAVRWETILHTPKYTQDKVRLMKDIDGLKARIAGLQQQLDEASKPMP
jgi:seryl-tRNA synthetase